MNRTIYPFTAQHRNRARSGAYPHSRERLSRDNPGGTLEEETSKRSLQKVGRAAYSSTLKFVDYITDLSLALKASPHKLETLRAALQELNNKLPAAAYIPFVNGRSNANE